MAQYSRPTTPLNGPDQTSQSRSPASPLNTNQLTAGPSDEGPLTSPWAGYQLHQDMMYEPQPVCPPPRSFFGSSAEQTTLANVGPRFSDANPSYAHSPASPHSSHRSQDVGPRFGNVDSFHPRSPMVSHSRSPDLENADNADLEPLMGSPTVSYKYDFQFGDTDDEIRTFLRDNESATNADNHSDMQADDNYNNSQADDGDADTQTHDWRSVNLQDIYVENAPDVSSQPDDQLQEKSKPQHPELKMQGRQPWRRVTKKVLEDGRKQLEEALSWSRSEEGQRCRRRHRELARAEIAKHRPPSPGPDDDFDLDWEEPPTASDALEVDIWASTTFQPKKTLYTGGFGFKANEAVGKDAYKVSIWDRTTFLPMETLYSGGFGFKVEEVDDEEETVVSGLEPTVKEVDNEEETVVSGLEPTVEEAEEGLMKDTDVSAVAKHGRDESSDDDNFEVDIWASTTFQPKKTLYTGGFGFKVRTLDRDLDDIRKDLARGEDFEVEEVDDEEETVVSGLEPIIEEAGEGLMKDTDLSAVAKHGGDESSDDDNSPKRQKR